jgi:toxin ParE1/3/4
LLGIRPLVLHAMPTNSRSPGLRSRRLIGFPYLAFYVERDDCIEVWRVLHAQRDIPAWLQNPES